MPDLLTANENAFAHLSGRCETLLYDRMRTVLIGSAVDETGHTRPKLNTTFDAFARHWSLTPRLCQPHQARTLWQGRVGHEVPEAQLRARPPLPRPGGLQHPLCHLAGGSRQPAHPRHHASAADRSLHCEGGRTVPVAGQGSLLDAMLRERVVAAAMDRHDKGNVVCRQAIMACQEGELPLVARLPLEPQLTESG